MSRNLADREVFVPHAFPEKQADLGQITRNYVEGFPDRHTPLLLLAHAWHAPAQPGARP